jgi:hypothetical protein
MLQELANTISPDQDHHEKRNEHAGHCRCGPGKGAAKVRSLRLRKAEAESKCLCFDVPQSTMLVGVHTPKR